MRVVPKVEVRELIAIRMRRDLTVPAGCWLLVTGDDRVSVMTDARFQATYKPAPAAEATAPAPAVQTPPQATPERRKRPFTRANPMPGFALPPGGHEERTLLALVDFWRTNNRPALGQRDLEALLPGVGVSARLSSLKRRGLVKQTGSNGPDGYNGWLPGWAPTVAGVEYAEQVRQRQEAGR